MADHELKHEVEYKKVSEYDPSSIKVEGENKKESEYDPSSIKVEGEAAPAPVKATDRGLFDFMGKKEEQKKPQEEAIATEFDQKVHVSEPEHKEGEKKHGSLLEKLHRSGSSSSSSSEEEVEEDGKKIKKKKEKKGLKEKIQEKITGDKKEQDETHIPVEKCEEPVHTDQAGHEAEEKKGFLDKIKDKFPGGGHKKAEEVPPPPAAECTTAEGEAKEKKGFLEKIKEKLPGYHHKTEEEKEKEKEKEKEAESH